MPIRQFVVCALAAACLPLLQGCAPATDTQEKIDALREDNARAYQTECGTVVRGEVKNPVSEEDGEAVIIDQVAGPNSVVILREGGPQLVRLLGLSNELNSFQRNLAQSVLNDYRGRSALFFESQEECSVQVNSAPGTTGTLIDVSRGDSLAEELIVAGAANPTAGDACNANLIKGCYQSFRDSIPEQTAGPISNFLWKPQAEKDGRLVILLNPGGVTVFVNGIALRNTGYSNGRATTARGEQGGCAYGRATVRVLDQRGRAYTFPGGATSYVIENGCNRVEF